MRRKRGSPSAATSGKARRPRRSSSADPSRSTAAMGVERKYRSAIGAAMSSASADARRRAAAGRDAVEALLLRAPPAQLARRPAVLAYLLGPQLLCDAEPVRGLAVAPLAEAPQPDRVRALGARAGVGGALPDVPLRRLPEQEVAEHVGPVGPRRAEVAGEGLAAGAVGRGAAGRGGRAHPPHPLRAPRGL